MALKKGLTIDPGHQGIGFDPGAVNQKEGLYESEIAMQISMYQFNRFKELGVPVSLTRTGTKKMSNTERTNLVKSIGYEDCISNHINAGGGDGAEVIHSIHANPSFAETILEHLTESGQNPRRVFSRRLSNNSKHDYYYMHRNTGSVQTVIVEYGFIDSTKDDIIQIKRDWKLLAEAVVKAYCKYRGYKYVAPNQKTAEPKPTVEYTKEFSDVPVNHGHVNAILKAKELGLMYGDGKYFKPNEPITRAEMASVIVRLYEKVKG